MANKVAQYRLASIRLAANGVDVLARFRVRLEAGTDTGDPPAGWYVMNLIVQNLRALEPTDDQCTDEEVAQDITRPFQERIAALERGGQPQ